MQMRAVAAVAAGLLVVGSACGSGTDSTGGDTAPDTSASVLGEPTTSVAAETTLAETSTSAAPTTIAETTTTVDPLSLPPEPLVSARAKPGKNEGQWKAVLSLAGADVIWTTSVHPVEGQSKVRANAAVFDQSRLVAALFNGTEVPGKKGLKNGSKVTKALAPSLVASFNGGFEFRHMKGGYFTEGRELKRLREGDATLGVDQEGQLVLGVYGDGITNDGTWVTLRQNLPPVVIDGEVSVGRYKGVYWGDNFGGVTVTYRSALCRIADGRLMYVAMGPVDIEPMARGLVAMGCELAMQLDINGHWPNFVWYKGLGSTKRTGVVIDSRMNGEQRVLRGWKKDFIALFDPATVSRAELA